MKQLIAIACVDATLVALAVYVISAHLLPTGMVAIVVLLAALGFNGFYLYWRFAGTNRSSHLMRPEARPADESTIIARAKRDHPALMRVAMSSCGIGVGLMFASVGVGLYGRGWNIVDAVRLIWAAVIAFSFIMFYRQYRKVP